MYWYLNYTLHFVILLHVIENLVIHRSTQVFDDDLQPCFERVSAYVKGYLTRRLLKTEKVQEIVRTIQVNSTVHVSSEQQKVGIYYGYSLKILNINFEGKN